MLRAFSCEAGNKVLVCCLTAEVVTNRTESKHGRVQRRSVSIQGKKTNNGSDGGVVHQPVRALYEVHISAWILAPAPRPFALIFPRSLRLVDAFNQGVSQSVTRVKD